MKVLSVGRSSRDDIIINDSAVTRHHLQLILHDDGSCSVVDCNSTNGTFVNGNKINGEVSLKPGDKVVIGRTTIPWEEYLKNPSENGESKKSNRAFIFLIISLVVLLIGGVGSYFYITHNKRQAMEVVEQKQQEADKEKAAANQAKADKEAAEKESQLNIDKAHKAEKNAETAKQESALTTQFYKELRGLSQDMAAQVCHQLNVNVSWDAKTSLSEYFDNADKNRKQAVVNAIQSIKRRHRAIQNYYESEPTDSVAGYY